MTIECYYKHCIYHDKQEPFCYETHCLASQKESDHFNSLRWIELANNNFSCESTIDVYLDNLSSLNPTPGGGYAGALCGAQAAALVLMVLNNARSKKSFEDRFEKIDEFKEKVTIVLQKFKKYMNEDQGIFNQILYGIKMPNDVPNVEHIREQTIINALDFGLRELTAFNDLLNYISWIIELNLYSKTIKSDLYASNHLIEGGHLIVETNMKDSLEYLKDENKKNDYSIKVETLLELMCEKINEINFR